MLRTPNTIHTTTRAVVLDATVMTRSWATSSQRRSLDDFEVLEDKHPQTIRYFESQIEHLTAQSIDPTKAPLIIAILDEINFPYTRVESSSQNIIDQLGDYVYIRHQIRSVSGKAVAQMDAPMEILALNTHGYLSLSEPTRDRDLLLRKLRQHDPGLGQPFRIYLEEQSDHTATRASFQAIATLALRYRDISGRKIALWFGYGGPNYSENLIKGHVTNYGRYIRQLTDLLVDARITLDILTPGTGSLVRTNPSATPSSGMDFASNASASANAYSFNTNYGFNSFVVVTGGTDFRGNDVKGEVVSSTRSAGMYYTLSYSPQNHIFNGNFRHITVTVKGHPDWRVLTKQGYFGLQYGGAKDVESQLHDDLSLATFEAMPFSNIGVSVIDFVRVSENPKLGALFRFTLLRSEDLQWVDNAATGQREAQVAISAAALDDRINVLGSKAGVWKLSAPEHPDPTKPLKTSVTLELNVPFLKLCASASPSAMSSPPASAPQTSAPSH